MPRRNALRIRSTGRDAGDPTFGTCAATDCYSHVRAGAVVPPQYMEEDCPCRHRRRAKLARPIRVVGQLLGTVIDATDGERGGTALSFGGPRLDGERNSAKAVCMRRL